MNTVIAVFANGGTMTTTQTALWQYDYGQVLIVQGIQLPTSYEVQFCNAGDSTTITSLGDSEGVVIPDQFLRNGETIYAYIYLHTGPDDGETEYKITIPVMDRAEPTDIQPTPQQESTIGQLVSALNDAVSHVDDVADGIPTAIGNALTEAKESGEFDGPQGERGPMGYSVMTVSRIYQQAVTDTPYCLPSDITTGFGGVPSIGDILIGPVTGTTDPGTTVWQIKGLLLNPQAWTLKFIGSIKGAQGNPGENGADGEDGYSPTVTVTEISGGHRVTITDAKGDHTFDVMDGTGGGGGTSDYDDLTNKPQIAGVTLAGNKSLSDLGIAAASDIPAVPVQSVNNKTGAVVLTAADLDSDFKAAILQIAAKVAYVDAQGQQYYDALHDALYPLISISAVYTQSGTVYDDASLDSLKADLVVTALYSGGSTATVASADYTLSGTLTAGASVVTVTYRGKTATFEVTVTERPVLSSISAAYTQSGIVLDTDTLDSLKADLVVTATYSDSSTEAVDPDDYTLSGTLSTGTSTITVSYASKTTTFTVTVSGYVTDGLIMWLDGERNGVDGAHTSTMSTWVDQSGNGWDWNNMGATVSAKAISFSGSNQYLKRAYNDLPTNVALIEVVFSSPHTGPGLVLSGFGDSKPGNILMGSGNSVLLHSGTNKSTWTKIPENDWGGIHSYSSGGYRDGVYDVESSVSSSWQYLYPAIGCYLGASGTNPEYPFKGSIYCIRLYSRVLTEAEILSNYAVDAARFGLGG